MNLKKAREAPAVRSEASRGPLRGHAALEKARTAFTKANGMKNQGGEKKGGRGGVANSEEAK